MRTWGALVLVRATSAQVSVGHWFAEQLRRRDLVGETDRGEWKLFLPEETIASLAPRMTVLLERLKAAIVEAYREHARAETKNPTIAVRNGLAAGARVISAAALIMMSVFGSFIINGDPTVKQFGVGLATGVAFAALSVLTFAPAVMTMAGKSAWWVPKWADRWLPHLDIEGAGTDEEGIGAGKAKKPKAKPKRKGPYDSMKL